MLVDYLPWNSIVLCAVETPSQDYSHDTHDVVTTRGIPLAIRPIVPF
jgi:hypothetical protein